LKIAQRNYNNLIVDNNISDTKVEFLTSDLVAFLKDSPEDSKNKNIVLVANLPYIPDNTFDNNAPENVQNREPRMAFV
jgi:methylase of polypeptide subunit release factors